MMKRVVYVVGGDSLVTEMFLRRGWDVGGPESHMPDLICFTGGEDVNPAVYGEENKGSRGWNDERDAFEVFVYNEFVGKVPLVGICRGGQLLNVLNGGEMIQHLGETISGVIMTADGRSVLVDHHQGMIVGEEGIVDDWIVHDVYDPDYVITYFGTKCLCFQPHPEWGHKPTEDYFFELLEDFL